MSIATQPPADKPDIAGYRFGGVELQTASERLWVSGEETKLSPMAFRFLLSLCRASGALLTRAQAFELLWPGGGNGSDEALAQIVAKVRQALGPHSAALVTLRGRGFRIDMPVEPIGSAYVDRNPGTTDVSANASSSEAAQPPQVIQAEGEKRGTFAHRLWLAAVLVLALALVAGIAAMRWSAPENTLLDGYAIALGQFGPISAQGARTLRDILARDDDGDRPSAQRMLESLLESEPHSAAAPFFLLYLIGNDPQRENEQRWRRTFDERLPASAPPYVQLLSRWVRIHQDEPGVELELLNAALKLEPSAWRLHLARGHVNLRLSHFDMALADFHAVPLSRLAPRYAMFVMSDRASLGDVAAMQAELPALAQRAPVLAGYVQARIETALGNWKMAQTLYETTAENAERDGLFGALSYAWLIGAAMAGEQGDWDGMARDAERAMRIGTEHGAHSLLSDGKTVLGYARYRQAKNTESIAAWDLAYTERQQNGNPTATARLWLLRARIDPIWGAGNPAPEVGQPTSTLGLDQLMAARSAWLDCRTDDASRALAAADTAGIGDGYFADEADLLRHDLGLPRRAAPAAPKIPYPMLERWISYWESSRSAGERTCAK